MAHTPTPWRAVALGSEGARIYPDCVDKRESMKHLAIVDGRDTTTAIANARLIVRAVNAFEPMREALKAIDTCWSDPADGYTKPDSKRSKSHLHPDTIKIWKQIRSALALADKDVRP